MKTKAWIPTDTKAMMQILGTAQLSDCIACDIPAIPPINSLKMVQYTKLRRNFITKKDMIDTRKVKVIIENDSRSTVSCCKLELEIVRVYFNYTPHKIY